MEKLKVVIYMNRSQDGTVYPGLSDMSQYGWVLLGTEEVEVTVPVVDEAQVRIDALNKQDAAIKAEAKAKRLAIDEEIKKLKESQK